MSASESFVVESVSCMATSAEPGWAVASLVNGMLSKLEERTGPLGLRLEASETGDEMVVNYRLLKESVKCVSGR